MTKRVALLFGAMVASAVSPGAAAAQGNQTDRGFSLPIGVTGPAAGSLDRLHTVPRLPVAGDSKPGLANGEEARALPKPNGVVTVSQ